MTNQNDTKLTAESLCNRFLEYCTDIEKHLELYPPQPTDVHTDPVTGKTYIYDAHDAEADALWSSWLDNVRTRQIAAQRPKQIHANATIIGTIDPSILSRPVTIAMGRNRQDQAFKNLSSSFGDLLTMLTEHKVGEKDGACLLQGELAGPQRVAKNAMKNYLVIIDIDTGESVVDITALLQNSGLFGLIWTTHSHMKTTSSIPEDQLYRFSKKYPGDPMFDEDNLARKYRQRAAECTNRQSPSGSFSY